MQISPGVLYKPCTRRMTSIRSEIVSSSCAARVISLLRSSFVPLTVKAAGGVLRPAGVRSVRAASVPADATVCAIWTQPLNFGYSEGRAAFCGAHLLQQFSKGKEGSSCRGSLKHRGLEVGRLIYWTNVWCPHWPITAEWRGGGGGRVFRIMYWWYCIDSAQLIILFSGKIIQY